MTIRLLKSRAAAVLLAMSIMLAAGAQSISQKEQLRIQIWADLDPFPGSFEDSPDTEDLPGPSAVAVPQENYSDDKDTAQDSDRKNGNAAGNRRFINSAEADMEPFRFAIERAKETAPFLMSGMLSGWKFDYTPSDKLRGVEEWWEFSETAPFNPGVNHITYHNPRVQDGKLLCWAYCDRTSMQQNEYERWASLNHPRIRGQGTGPVERGFDGIKEACGQAVKNAVHEYWRTQVKNKPKEISGSVLVIRTPRIYVKDGNYVVELDFFLETDRIVGYTIY